jgi:hypothetical protein
VGYIFYIFNGVAAFIEDVPITTVQTDSCLAAAGAFYNGDFFYTVWEADHPQIATSCINYKEAMIATLALQQWGHLFTNKCVVIYTDNQCAASILSRNTCKNKALMQSMRDMFWTAVKYNFIVKAIYMPGHLQTIPDVISRFHEHGGLVRVKNVMNAWYMCHKHCFDALEYFSMSCHMSFHSMLFILEQIMAWRKWKFR